MTANKTEPKGLTTKGEIRAYFACLASYNEGTLHGAWVNLEACETPEDIQECIDQIIKDSPTPGAEEWAMHDSEGLPKSMALSEYIDFQSLINFVNINKQLKEFNDEDLRLAYDIYCDECWSEDDLPTIETFQDHYMGLYDSPAEFAEDYYESSFVEKGFDLSINGPDEFQLLAYVDWDAVWYGQFHCKSWHAARLPRPTKSGDFYAIFSP